MKDAVDLSLATIHSSPAVASWPVTANITHARETPHGGFELFFDRTLPESWKWPSNPDVPSDNFQYTVWIGVQISGIWHFAGFVQMWQGRAMGQGALPAIFAINDGAQGFRNWWGDVRHLWGSMSDYVPQDGDPIAMLVSAGNGRLRSDVTSVAERSNVVLFRMRADDTIDAEFFAQDPVPVPVPVPPAPVPLPPPVQPPSLVLATKADLDAMEARLTAKFDALEKNLLAAAAYAKPTIDFLYRWFGVGKKAN